jgi:hypothetical protein
MKVCTTVYGRLAALGLAAACVLTFCHPAHAGPAEELKAVQAETKAVKAEIRQRKAAARLQKAQEGLQKARQELQSLKGTQG